MFLHRKIQRKACSIYRKNKTYSYSKIPLTMRTQVNNIKFLSKWCVCVRHIFDYQQYDSQVNVLHCPLVRVTRHLQWKRSPVIHLSHAQYGMFKPFIFVSWSTFARAINDDSSIEEEMQSTNISVLFSFVLALPGPSSVVLRQVVYVVCI